MSKTLGRFAEEADPLRPEEMRQRWFGSYFAACVFAAELRFAGLPAEAQQTVGEDGKPVSCVTWFED